MRFCPINAQYTFFELKKINKKINKNNRLELWLQFLNAESEEELAMPENTNIKPIQKAVMIIHKMSADEKIREIARIREKALHDGLRHSMERR